MFFRLSVFSLMFCSALLGQSPKVDAASILSSSRPDLWVWGKQRNPETGSVLVEIASWGVPPKNWGSFSGSAPYEVLYSERPDGWDWEHRPAQQISRVAEPLMLCKYDNRSAFSPNWGSWTTVDGRHYCTGTIIRFENDHLKLIPNALSQARTDYKLSETQWFAGMVQNCVFYCDDLYEGRLFFFDIDNPEKRFQIQVPVRENWSKKYKLDSVDQVFAGKNTNEILAYVWVRYTGLIAWYRRFSRGIAIDLQRATPFNPNQPKP